MHCMLPRTSNSNTNSKLTEMYTVCIKTASW